MCRAKLHEAQFWEEVFRGRGTTLPAELVYQPRKSPFEISDDSDTKSPFDISDDSDTEDELNVVLSHPVVNFPSDEPIIDAPANEPIGDVTQTFPYLQDRQKIIHIAYFKDKTTHCYAAHIPTSSHGGLHVSRVLLTKIYVHTPNHKCGNICWVFKTITAENHVCRCQQ